MQACHCLLGVKSGSGDRQPAVAKFHYTLQGVVARSAEQDRRVGSLQRLGIHPDGIEAHHFAVENRLVLSPQALHRQNALAHQLEAGVIAGSVIFHLIDIPTATDAEKKSTSGQLIQTRNAFRRHDRITLRDEANSCAQQDLSGCGGRKGQRNEWVVRVRVRLG